MSTGEAIPTDASGEDVAVVPAAKTKAKTKEGGPKKVKKPAKVAAKNGSAKAAEVAKAAPVKTAPAKTAKGTPDRASYRVAADLLKMASDATRVTVLMILADGSQNVGDLCSHLEQSQPAVSHHLALLRHGGLVYPTRNGKNNTYALTPKGATLAAAIERVLEAEI